MIRYLAISFLFLQVLPLFAVDSDSVNLKENETAMRILIQEVRTNKLSKIRIESSLQLEELMEKTLKAEGAFAYPFDNIQGVSIQQPADNAFRIFTWQVYVDEGDYQYRGFIQTKDGKVIKLEDQSDDMFSKVEFSTLKPSNWYGALYYNIKPFKQDGQTCYLLFGFDAFSFFNRRKVLDVLYFDDKGRARFGKNVIEMKDYKGRLRQVKRMLLEYSATVSVTLNYKESEDLVIYDHLIYGTPFKDQRPTNLPDGSYCGLKYNASTGMWKYVDKVYKDDPANVLINATSYEEMMDEDKKPRRKQKDIFGRSK